MEVQTSAIVISSIKYGDSGLIVKCYTKKSGIKSFILKNAFSGKNKKSSVFTTLNQIKIIYEEKKGKNLNYLKEAEGEFYYQSVYGSPVKTSITLFIGELLNSVLQEEEANSSLYNFISTGFLDFDSKPDNYSDFHLWFLLNLSRFLGFYPHFSEEYVYFDLANGVSTNDFSSGFVIEKEDLLLFRNLIQMNFSSRENSKFSQIQRKKTLEIIVKYYELHISDFRRPKSLDVLHQVFE